VNNKKIHKALFVNLYVHYICKGYAFLENIPELQVCRKIEYVISG